jgi:hypothetical protein
MKSSRSDVDLLERPFEPETQHSGQRSPADHPGMPVVSLTCRAENRKNCQTLTGA